MNCERCGKPSGGYDLHDYCAYCSKNLCAECMETGCCGHIPAESGSEEDHDEEEGEEPHEFLAMARGRTCKLCLRDKTHPIHSVTTGDS